MTDPNPPKKYLVTLYLDGPSGWPVPGKMVYVKVDEADENVESASLSDEDDEDIPVFTVQVVQVREYD